MSGNAQVDTNGRMTRRVITNPTRPPRYIDGVLRPWSISLDKAVISFTDCIYQRGPVVVQPTVADYTVTGSDGAIFISAKVNTEDGTVSIIEGATLASVTDAEIPENSEFFRIPLYKLNKITLSGNVYLAVILDLRNIMQVVAYV